MGAFLEALFWAIVGIVSDRLFSIYISPIIMGLWRKYVIWRANRLYYSEKTSNYLKEYYGDDMSNCSIGNVSRQIAYLSNPDWENLNIDIMAKEKIISFVETDRCDYKIHKTRLEARKKRGYILDDNPSLFLHRVKYSAGQIQIEVGEYSYFQRISFTSDFENETYKCAF